MTEQELEILKQDPRKAIQQFQIICLVCGESFRQLTNTHLKKHQMTAEDYKEIYGYNRSTALMCGDLLWTYSERACQRNLAGFRKSKCIFITKPELRYCDGTSAFRLEGRLNLTESAKRGSQKREHSYEVHPNLKTSITLEKIQALWDDSQSFKKNCQRIARILGCGWSTVRRRILGQDYKRKT